MPKLSYNSSLGISAILRVLLILLSTVKYHNRRTLMAFIGVARGPHRLVTTSLPFISEISGQPATVRSLHLAATMRHAFIFLKVEYSDDSVLLAKKNGRRN